MFDRQNLAKLIEGAQSKRAIKNQLIDGYHYFSIEKNKDRIGYFAYQKDQDNNSVFLSKLYLHENQRGKGIGRKVLQHLEKLCRDHDINKLVLTVYHKNINSIMVYEKWGFLNLGLIKRSFEDGFVFEDIKMEKPV